MWEITFPERQLTGVIGRFLVHSFRILPVVSHSLISGRPFEDA